MCDKKERMIAAGIYISFYVMNLVAGKLKGMIMIKGQI
jgi:hypothetical protein